MGTDLEDQLATYFEWVESSQPVARTVGNAGSRRPALHGTGRTVLAAAAVLTLVVAGLVVLVRRPGGTAPAGPATQPTITEPVTTEPAITPGPDDGGWFDIDLPDAARLSHQIDTDVGVPRAGARDYVWGDLATDPVRGMYVRIDAPFADNETVPSVPDYGEPVEAPDGVAWFADIGGFHRLYWHRPTGLLLEAGGTNVDDDQLADWLYALGDPPTHPDPAMYPLPFDTHDIQPRYTEFWSIAGPRLQATVLPADAGDVFAWGLRPLERVTVDGTPGFRGMWGDRTVVAWPLDDTYWARLDIPAELADRADDIVAAVTVRTIPWAAWPTEWVEADGIEITRREVGPASGVEIAPDGPVAVWADLTGDPIRVMSLRIVMDTGYQLGDPTWRSSDELAGAPDGTTYTVAPGSLVWERPDGTVVLINGTAVDEDQLAAWAYDIVTSGLIGPHPDPAFEYVPVAAGFDRPVYTEWWQTDQGTYTATARADGLGVALSRGAHAVLPIDVADRRAYLLGTSSGGADDGLLLIPLDAGYWASVPAFYDLVGDGTAVDDALRIVPMPMHPSGDGNG